MSTIPNYSDSEFDPAIERMELSNDLEQDLNMLIQEHGLTALLEALKQVVEIKADAIASSAHEPDDNQAKTLQTLSHLFTELIETIPPELEVELALAQVMRPSADLEADRDKLASGLE